jgi:hypothetical protein
MYGLYVSFMRLLSISAGCQTSYADEQLTAKSLVAASFSTFSPLLSPWTVIPLICDPRLPDRTLACEGAPVFVPVPVPVPVPAGSSAPKKGVGGERGESGAPSPYSVGKVSLYASARSNAAMCLVFSAES